MPAPTTMPLELTTFEAEILLRVLRQVNDDTLEGDHYGLTPVEIGALRRVVKKAEALAAHLVVPEDAPVRSDSTDTSRQPWSR